MAHIYHNTWTIKRSGSTFNNGWIVRPIFTKKNVSSGQSIKNNKLNTTKSRQKLEGGQHLEKSLVLRKFHVLQLRYQLKKNGWSSDRTPDLLTWKTRDQNSDRLQWLESKGEIPERRMPWKGNTKFCIQILPTSPREPWNRHAWDRLQEAKTKQLKRYCNC